MTCLGAVFFAIALNVDALNVGISYGIREIKVPIKSLFMIVIISMASIVLSMSAGSVIDNLIGPKEANLIGSFIFLIMGAHVLYRFFNKRTSQQEQDSNEAANETATLFRFKLLSIIIVILREPHLFDTDNSGKISMKEAFLLGLGLSMDSFATGVAISLMNYNIIDTALLVGLFQYISITLGIWIGYKLKESRLGKYLGFIPGMILLVLGISRFRLR